MQMFGVGLPELMVILVIAVVVVGPDRLPEFAANLARWIRQARAYGQHLTRDFNEVMGDLEKEVGASREDWKEIASLVTRQGSDISRVLNEVTGEVSRSVDLADVKADAPPANVVPIDSARTADEIGEPAADDTQPEETPASDGEEKPWYVPERTTRRRTSE